VVLIAGMIGFVGNEVVAIYRIRVGRRIGSAALVADGVHARSDSFTSLAVVLGVIGIWLGFPLADPIVGLVICIAIFVLLWGTARDVEVHTKESATTMRPGQAAMSSLRPVPETPDKS
jgi:divalent metal cation (Fe/Co/Zn/Cd) transporter